MARTTVEVEGRIELVNFDEPKARGRIFQSLAVAQLVDEISGDPLDASIAVSTSLAGARVRKAGSGIVGLVGTPARSFPRLDTSAYSFDLGFTVRGFTPWNATLSLPVQPAFPDRFDDLNLGPVEMRREPFVLTGRTTFPGAGHGLVPCPNATVSLTGLWRRTGEIDLGAGPSVVPILAVAPALAAPRPAGATIEIVALLPVAEPTRVLLFDVAEGGVEIGVSQSIGLLAGQVVGIDVADPQRAEYVEVASLAASSDPDSPATAVLRCPLRRRHPRGTVVQRVAVPPAGPADAVLADDGAPFDPTLFVDTTAPFTGSTWVRIAGGGSAPEYTVCFPYEVQSDAEGFYRMPPLSRVAAFEVSASRASPLPALSSPATAFTPNYALYENRLDLPLR